ncbi:MAG: hypothetical protein PHE53_07725, partial [Thermoguttaceae bacterium]|nr:hypothetical protein [Thermoguttaceae bacterium]
MSRFRIPLLRKFTETFSSSRKHSARSGSSQGRQRKPRRLLLDTLEERRLLSLAPADTEESLVTDNLGWAYSSPTGSVGAEDTVTPYGTYAYSEERVQGTDGRYYPKYIVVPGTVVSQSDRSMDASRDDDFAMTWTQVDTIQQAKLNSDGKVVIDTTTGMPDYDVIIDPTTNEPLIDKNVYAKYLTDEVQRITLPTTLLDGQSSTSTDSAANGTFTIHYGGNEIQKLTISTATEVGGGTGTPVTGHVTLGFDLNGNGVIENSERTTVVYDESNIDSVDLTWRPEYIIQTELRKLGGALSDVRVQALTSREFYIHFGDASNGAVQPLIQIMTDTTKFNTGFLPWAIVEKYHEPIEVTVNVYPNDLAKTAAEIEKAFKDQTQSLKSITDWEANGDNAAEHDVQVPGSQVTEENRLPSTGDFIETIYADVAVSAKVVTEGLPNGSFGFELTFTGAQQSKDIPEVWISKATEVTQNPITGKWATTTLSKAELDATVNSEGQKLVTVRTIQETSDVFRVNSIDPVDPLTLAPRPLNQYDSQIAMSADGNFAVAWTSTVTDTGSFTDIYARQFNPTSLVDYVVSESSGTYEHFTDTQTQGHMITDHGYMVSVTDSLTFLGIQSDRLEFRVNTTTAGVQNRPSISMDDAGDFVIGWQTLTQDQSWFNSASIQRYDASANRVGGEMVIAPEDTVYKGYISVEMSRDGYTAVVWQSTLQNPVIGADGEPNYHKGSYLRILDPNGVWTSGTIMLMGSTFERAAMAWDSGNGTTYGSMLTVALTNSDSAATSAAQGGYDENVYGWQFHADGANVRTIFDVNGATSTTGGDSTRYWSGWQSGPSIGVDADGDLYISYEGRGVDVSTWIAIIASDYFADAIADPQNVDIWQYLVGIKTGRDVDLLLRDTIVQIYSDTKQNLLTEDQYLVLYNAYYTTRLQYWIQIYGANQAAQIQTLYTQLYNNVRDAEVARLLGLPDGTAPTNANDPYYNFTQVTCNQATLNAYQLNVYGRLVNGTWDGTFYSDIEARTLLGMPTTGTSNADPNVMAKYARQDGVHAADLQSAALLEQATQQVAAGILGRAKASATADADAWFNEQYVQAIADPLAARVYAIINNKLTE